MSARRLQFWFEFASTYSYPAAARIEAACAAVGVALSWHPFLLGPIFAAQGWTDSPFNLYPAKGRYMWRDLERTCARLSLPFVRPSRFPRNGLLAARVAACAAAEPWLPAFVRAVYHANFVEDQEIADARVISAVVDGLGQPGAAWIERAQREDAKQALRAQTDRARSAGLFGAPTFVVDDELFWGNDRLDEAIGWCLR
jgi:2-hydroxychromene-2-carboxylate isomerase